MITVNEYFKSHRADGWTPFQRTYVVPRIQCADGFSLSVQASDGHYCQPRKDSANFYWQVEVGFPSEAEACLMEYAEDSTDPTGTVYGYVPVGLVDGLIRAHGGIAGDAS